MKTNTIIQKLHPRTSQCKCGEIPCTRQVIPVAWGKIKGGRFGWTPRMGKKNKPYRICENCLDVLLGELGKG